MQPCKQNSIMTSKQRQKKTKSNRRSCIIQESSIPFTSSPSSSRNKLDLGCKEQLSNNNKRGFKNTTLQDSKNQRLHSAFTITNQSLNHHKSAYQLYAQRRSTRVVGSMLSSLSRSDKKRCDELRQEMYAKQNDTKQNRRKKISCQNRIDAIHAMRYTYMQKNREDNQLLIDTNRSSPRHHNILSFRRTRSPDKERLSESQNKENDDSMMELIDWLENVDLTGIDDFI